MSVGLIAFIVGALAVVLAYLGGWRSSKKETTTKLSGEITIQRQKAETAQKERDLAVAAAQAVQQQTAESDTIKQFFNEFESKKTEADETNNVDIAIEAAKVLAERAAEWQRRNR